MKFAKIHPSTVNESKIRLDMKSKLKEINNFRIKKNIRGDKNNET